LTTGTAVHSGIQVLLTHIKDHPTDLDISDGKVLQEAIEKGKATYEEIVKHQYKGIESDYGNEFTFLEQSALTEALILIWALVEMPDLYKDYKVVEVEKEEYLTLHQQYNAIDSNEDIILEARSDGILESRNAKNTYLSYNLKTAKRWDERNRDGFSTDLQGLTETAAIRARWQREDESMAVMFSASQQSRLSDKHKAAMLKMKDMYASRGLTGVRYCVLVKGDYKEPWEGADFKATHNPLIRGYKKVNPGEIEYSHSWFFDNPNNKSGKGALGKGWESFNVWEKFDLKDWIYKCFSGEVQPQAQGNIGKLVQTLEVYRNDADVKRAITSITEQEINVNTFKEGFYNTAFEDFDATQKQEIEALFPMYRRSCLWPTKCDYYNVCHKGHTIEIGNGWEYREPHHERERDET
jgi:hypothetical protein